MAWSWCRHYIRSYSCNCRLCFYKQTHSNGIFLFLLYILKLLLRKNKYLRLNYSFAMIVILLFCILLQHPLLMALLTISIAMLGFGIAKGFRYFVKCQRKSLLEPPVDLFPEEKEDMENIDIEKNNEKEKHPKYSKAQARQRFRKGKS